MTKPVLLQLDNICAGYGEIDVLQDISIKLLEGELISVVGPNGAGKTTLFKTISGIVTPSSGQIHFRENDLLGVEASRRAHLGLAHVPEGRQVFPSLTILENLEMGAFAEKGRAEFKENLEKIISWFPVLGERREQLAGTLSGGEQQMLAIGRGLAASPDILMLDEPSMGLAPAIVDEIFERLIEIHRTSELSVILVEQRVAEALHFANRAYVLEAGKIILSGKPEELQNDDRIRQAYLGM
ncbi:MAG: ABC transporter ATP-binding protein [Gammaproteobacteria bacterium]|jgi:branched-chain amino acid transport system ATP-binding protein|nr:ABC transporter ATP-binding protein [Gammaproteobacteria bacterium]